VVQAFGVDVALLDDPCPQLLRLVVKLPILEFGQERSFLDFALIQLNTKLYSHDIPSITMDSPNLNELVLHTLDLLTWRLKRLEFLLNGGDTTNETPEDASENAPVIPRLHKLQQSLHKLASKNATVHELLRLRTSPAHPVTPLLTPTRLQTPRTLQTHPLALRPPPSPGLTNPCDRPRRRAHLPIDRLAIARTRRQHGAADIVVRDLDGAVAAARGGGEEAGGPGARDRRAAKEECRAGDAVA
jgi:hypothetical protein